MAKLYNLDKYSGEFKIQLGGIQYTGKALSVKQAIQYAQKLKEQELKNISEFEKLQDVVEMIASCIDIPKEIIEKMSPTMVGKIAQLIQSGEMSTEDEVVEGGEVEQPKNQLAE